MDTPLDAFQGPSAPIFDQLSLGAAMSQLPTGYQEIFNLHDVEGYTHQEVCSIIGHPNRDIEITITQGTASDASIAANRQRRPTESPA